MTMPHVFGPMLCSKCLFIFSFSLIKLVFEWIYLYYTFTNIHSQNIPSKKRNLIKLLYE